MNGNYGCNCEKPNKVYSTSGCQSCWTCGDCGKFGGCDNMINKFSQDAEKIWGGKNKSPYPSGTNYYYSSRDYHSYYC